MDEFRFLGNGFHVPMTFCPTSTTAIRYRSSATRDLTVLHALVREGRTTRVELTDKGRRIVEQLKEAEEIFDS